VQDAVGVGAEAATPAPALHKLDQAERLELVKVALNGAYGAAEDGRKSLHPRPAKTGAVVGMVAQGLVGGQDLDGATTIDEVRDFGSSGKLLHVLLCRGDREV